MVGTYVGGNGIHAMDRGGDRGKFYQTFLERGVGESDSTSATPRSGASSTNG
jgi:hypothetical protein